MLYLEMPFSSALWEQKKYFIQVNVLTGFCAYCVFGLNSLDPSCHFALNVNSSLVVTDIPKHLLTQINFVLRALNSLGVHGMVARTNPLLSKRNRTFCSFLNILWTSQKTIGEMFCGQMGKTGRIIWLKWEVWRCTNTELQHQNLIWKMGLLCCIWSRMA